MYASGPSQVIQYAGESLVATAIFIDPEVSETRSYANENRRSVSDVPVWYDPNNRCGFAPITAIDTRETFPNSGPTVRRIAAYEIFESASSPATATTPSASCAIA